MVTFRLLQVRVLPVAFAFALVVATASAVDGATASWDPNPEPNIAGYKVSYGNEPGVHGTTVDVGNVTTFTFNATPGRRYYLVVQAYNSDNLLSAKSDEVMIDIPPVITQVNRPPTLVQPSDQTSKQNTAVSLALVASDPDGNALVYSANRLPPGLSINPTSGIIGGVVTTLGSFSPVTVTASDGTLSASASFTWTVTAEGPVQTNRAPTLAQPADQTNRLNERVTFALVASHPDGKTLSYSSTGLPPGLGLHSASGIIGGRVSQVGTYRVSVTASDGALSASRSFTWTVQKGSQRTSTSVESTALTEGEVVHFYSARTLSGVTALQDGRLLLIEDERSLRMLVPGSSVSPTVLDDSDASKSFTEVRVNAAFPATHHVFVGVVSRLDAETSEFAVVRYREVQGHLGEGAAVVSGLRFRGATAPRFTVDQDQRIYVAMPETEPSDPYSANILRFNADGTVPAENRVPSPVFARGFSRPADLGWDGPVLVATGADQQWSFAAAQLDPERPSNNWPRALQPISSGSSASIIAAAFGVGSGDDTLGIRAFIDSSGRLFRRSLTSLEHQGTFAEVPLSSGLEAVSVASGVGGQLYVIARSATGYDLLLAVRSAQ